ncbi:hypothetical protein Vi05172_g7168 [Venturia inaequalis]|nr:hypothetical protein Vi05172_g7168 [Venturia inaequalis]
MLDATTSASAQGAIEEAPRCPIREALTETRIRFLAAQRTTHSVSLAFRVGTQKPQQGSKSSARNNMSWYGNFQLNARVIVCTSTRFGTTCIGLHVPRILRGPNDPL